MTATRSPIRVADFAIDGLETYSLGSASPCQYRFLDCQRLLKENVIYVVAFLELPTQPYAVVSYPWRPATPATNISASFKVKAIEKEPRISVDVLKTIFIAASFFGCHLLWIDKLCARQDSRAPGDGKLDNEWQVQNMHSIYRGCSTCLALPGGLSRLATLDERTNWMERAWTLQEALAPPAVNFIIDWTKGDAILQHNASIAVKEVLPGKAAVIELKALLEGSLKSEVRLITNESKDDSEKYLWQTLRLLGNANEVQDSYPIMALLGAMDHTNDTGRLNAIWRCTTMRSAKYAADMIYSIMGLMDITLTNIESAKDPQEVVVEFTRALTQKGHQADWLGVAPNLGPWLRMSAMPLLPMSEDDGKGKTTAYIEVGYGKLAKVKDLLEKNPRDMMWWWLKNAPKGVVDQSGYLTFTSLATSAAESKDKTVYSEYRLQRDHPGSVIHCSSNRAWDILPELRSPHFVVVIGTKEQYLSGIFSSMVDPNTTLLMLVEEGREGTFRNVGYAWADENASKGWIERTFMIGG
ncbi:hypothetical protein OEA41_004199 [Lepraria neglecta]|uniref:Heterokaryon incompatibility domain-containing protein n=1 Tax=Lepraria neglecta TaxID=209136 RepID=A0AAD9Z5W9_9LECA|nr:hypothetical protein OEA41_004199 [Lepraria neglecta]